MSITDNRVSIVKLILEGDDGLPKSIRLDRRGCSDAEEKIPSEIISDARKLFAKMKAYENSR